MSSFKLIKKPRDSFKIIHYWGWNFLWRGRWTVIFTLWTKTLYLLCLSDKRQWQFIYDMVTLHLVDVLSSALNDNFRNFGKIFWSGPVLGLPYALQQNLTQTLYLSICSAVLMSTIILLSTTNQGITNNPFNVRTVILLGCK